MQAVTFLQPMAAAGHRQAQFIIIVVVLFAQKYDSTRIYIDTVERSRTARSDKNTNSCSKTFNKTVTG